MLAEDATITMPPLPTWYRGREAVAAFLGRWPLADGRRWRLVPVSANGQQGFGHYRWDAEHGSFAAHSVNVLTLRGKRIEEITAFLTADVFGRFGLPARIQA